jgi:hypothetical protein
MTVKDLWRPAVVVVAAAVWGVVAARWTPRGPLTNAEALWSIGISAVVGLAAGGSSRSRWSMLTAPAAFVLALEVTRMGVRGPSVDAPHLSPFGIIALVTGRGVHGALSVLPLVLGTAYGAGLSRRTRRAPVPGGPGAGLDRPAPRWPSVVRRAGTEAAAALAAVTVAVAILPVLPRSARAGSLSRQDRCRRIPARHDDPRRRRGGAGAVHPGPRAAPRSAPCAATSAR